MTLLRNGPAGPARSTIESWAETFPRRLRPTLLLGLIGVTLVAIAVRAPFFGIAFTAPDTAEYLGVAEGVFHGGYASYLRPPGYATLLAIIEVFGVGPIHAVVVLQNLIGIALPACVLLAGWRFFSPVVGCVSGFLTAASPLAIAIEQFALSDYLFSVLLFATVVVLAEAVLQMRGRGTLPWRLLVLAGALFGVATLFRANGLFGLIALPAALLIGGPPWRPALRASAIAMTAMVVVIAPWCIHNLIRFGDPSVASEGGISLYARAVSYDEVPPPTATAEGRLANRVYNAADTNEQEAAVGTTLGTYVAIVNQTGKSPGDAAGAMGQIAREAILSDLGRYLERSIEILGRYQAVYDPQGLDSDPQDQIAITRGYIRTLDSTQREPPGDSALTRIPWQIAQALTKLLFVLTIGGLLMLALPFFGGRRGRLAASTFLLIGLLHILGATLTARFEMRHVIVLAPMVWILATATVAQTVSLIVAGMRQLPRRRTQGAPA